MYGQHYKLLNRWRMHHIIIQPPSCYRCATCGLCGDFKHVGGVRQMQNCHGDDFTFNQGAVGIAFDPQGWTWEADYVQNECGGHTIYVPPTCNDCDPCSQDIRPAARTACQAILNQPEIAACCASMGGDVCANAVENAIEDTCIVASDALTVDCAFLTTVIMQNCDECNIPENAPSCDPGVTVPTGCDIDEWGAWDPCTKYCGSGTKTRTRTVTPIANTDCSNVPRDDTVSCNVQTCCEDGDIKQFDWEKLTELGEGIPQLEVTLFNVNKATLTLDIIVELDYLGTAYADRQDDPHFGATYVLDFEDFNAHKDKINEPGNCQNRKAGSFETCVNDFDTCWAYSIEPQNGNVGQPGEFLAYPEPPSDTWSVSMKGNQCNKIVYEGHFSWEELRNCKSFDGGVDESYTHIEPDPDHNWLNLTGTFYINVVSPFWFGASDTGFYRVYQILSQPFVIAVSSTVYVVGHTGINLLESCPIAVYKEDQASDFRVVIMTEAAEYMRLKRTDTSTFKFTKKQGNLNDFANTQFTVSNDPENANCLSNKNYICTQLWEISVDNIACVKDKSGTDFSGTYELTFQAECIPDHKDEQHCIKWLGEHSDVINIQDNQILLTTHLSWQDNICTPEVWTVQFGADMLFYTNNLYRDGEDVVSATPNHLYKVGKDTIYVEVRTDFPDDTLTIFDTELVSVRICTFAPDTDVPDDQEAANWATEMGCFNGGKDDYAGKLNGHIYERGSDIEMDYDFEIETVNVGPSNDYVRFYFTCPPQVARDTLWIHAQIEVSLTEVNGNRRRMLIDTSHTANQMRHFVDEIGIGGVDNDDSNEPNTNDEPKNNKQPNINQPQTPPQQPQQPVSSTFYLSLSSPYVIAIGCLLAIILCCNVIFMVYMNCCKGQRPTVLFSGARSNGYKSVKAADSEYDSENSEVNAINVISE